MLSASRMLYWCLAQQRGNTMAKPQTVFVTIEVTLTDPDEWTLAFGVEGCDAIKKDVKELVVSNARDSLIGSGEITAEVTGW